MRLNLSLPVVTRFLCRSLGPIFNISRIKLKQTFNLGDLIRWCRILLPEQTQKGRCPTTNKGHNIWALLSFSLIFLIALLSYIGTFHLEWTPMKDRETKDHLYHLVICLSFIFVFNLLMITPNSSTLDVFIKSWFNTHEGQIDWEFLNMAYLQAILMLTSF